MRALLLDEDEPFYQTAATQMQKYGVILDRLKPLHFKRALTKGQLYEFIFVEVFSEEQCHLELISQLKQYRPAARVYVLTSNPSISTAVVAIKLGAENYFSKTVAIDNWLPVCLSQPTVSVVHSVDDLKWMHMKNVLTKANGNVTAAAKVLGITRRTLHRQINKHQNIRAVKDA